MTTVTKSPNSADSSKLQFLDDLYIEHHKEGFVKVGLTKDVINQNGKCLTYFRIFQVKPRRD